MELNALFQLKRVGKSIVGDVGKLCGEPWFNFLGVRIQLEQGFSHSL